MARDFNDNEAVWQAFEDRKRFRERFGSPLPIDEDTADALDWLWAERNARPVRAIGVSTP